MNLGGNRKDLLGVCMNINVSSSFVSFISADCGTFIGKLFIAGVCPEIMTHLVVFSSQLQSN